MTQFNPLITAEDLRDLLTPTTMIGIFDDANTGNLTTVLRSNPVTLVLKQAHARCVAWLPAIYRKIPDGDDDELPELLRGVELEYAKAMAWDRHREYARASKVDVEALYARADLTMQRIQESKLRIADSPPEPQPANVGGFVRNNGTRVFCNGSDGQNNSGDF